MKKQDYPTEDPSDVTGYNPCDGGFKDGELDPYDDPNLDEYFIHAADDRDFRIELVSFLITMLIMVGLLFAGKAVIKQIKEYIDEKNPPAKELDYQLELELDPDSLLTGEELDQLEDELNELNENLDNLEIELSPKEPSGSPEE